MKEGKKDLAVENTKRPCPLCGSIIAEAARICPFCQERLSRLGRVASALRPWFEIAALVGLIGGIVAVLYTRQSVEKLSESVDLQNQALKLSYETSRSRLDFETPHTRVSLAADSVILTHADTILIAGGFGIDSFYLEVRIEGVDFESGISFSKPYIFYPPVFELRSDDEVPILMRIPIGPVGHLNLAKTSLMLTYRSRTYCSSVREARISTAFFVGTYDVKQDLFYYRSFPQIKRR